MGRLTFEDLTPDDMPEPYVSDDFRADDFRDELLDQKRTATMPMRTIEFVLAQRPTDAKLPHDEETARSLRDLVDSLDDAFHAKGLDWLNDEQVAALWCADVEDTFNMLQDFTVRMGVDHDEVQHVVEELFDMLPV